VSISEAYFLCRTRRTRLYNIYLFPSAFHPTQKTLLSNHCYPEVISGYERHWSCSSKAELCLGWCDRRV